MSTGSAVEFVIFELRRAGVSGGVRSVEKFDGNSRAVEEVRNRLCKSKVC